MPEPTEPIYCGDCEPIKHGAPYVNVRLCPKHGAVDSLVEALIGSAHLAADGSGYCWCAVDDRVFGHREVCAANRAALALAEKGENHE